MEELESVKCEYGRCGGRGMREVKSKRTARLIVEVAGEQMRVCESCADLLRRDARANRESIPSQDESEP